MNRQTIVDNLEKLVTDEMSVNRIADALRDLKKWCYFDAFEVPKNATADDIVRIIKMLGEDYNTQYETAAGDDL